MKNLLLLAMLAAALPALAQTTNAPAVTSAPVTINTAPASSAAYYRVVYDPASKKIVALIYSASVTKSAFSISTCETYAQAEAFAATNGLTGLPKQKPAQP